MSDKAFQFLDLPRQTPRTVPVQVRVMGYGEIAGDFALFGSVAPLFALLAQPHRGPREPLAATTAVDRTPV